MIKAILNEYRGGTILKKLFALKSLVSISKRIRESVISNGSKLLFHNVNYTMYSKFSIHKRN
nr:MAG TPA: hypothetical protein [Caudoviricetes sp.]